jgi:hypothetical protein
MIRTFCRSDPRWPPPGAKAEQSATTPTRRTRGSNRGTAVGGADRSAAGPHRVPWYCTRPGEQNPMSFSTSLHDPS